jgi:hypothetical protein
VPLSVKISMKDTLEKKYLTRKVYCICINNCFTFYLGLHTTTAISEVLQSVIHYSNPDHLEIDAGIFSHSIKYAKVTLPVFMM